MNLSHILAPLFLCLAAGVLIGRWRKIGPEPFVAAVMDLFMPALVFDALVTANIPLSEMLSAGMASALVILLLLILCLFVRGVPLRTFALPVLFMNAGFLGMPLMDLAFGREAVGRIVVYDQVQSLFMFTLGIWIAAPRLAGKSVIAESLLAFLREPLVYAIIAAAGLRMAEIHISESILGPIRFLGSSTPPLALFAVGLRLAATPLRFFSDRRILKYLGLILILRFLGGLGCGAAVCAILSLEGLTRQVVLIASALPSAVFSYILAERYNAEPDLAAAAVFTSTLFFLPLLPFLLRLSS